MVVEAVQAGHLLAHHLVEHAPFAEQLGHAGAERGPEHEQGAPLVDGELHLVGAVHADAGGGVGGEAGQEPGQAAHLHVLLVDHPLLAQADDLLAGGEQVAGLPHGLDVLLHQVDIALAHLDEMGLDGVAGVGLSAHLYGDALSLVCAEFHGKTFFCVYCPSYYSQPGDNVQPKVLL